MPFREIDAHRAHIGPDGTYTVWIWREFPGGRNTRAVVDVAACCAWAARAIALEKGYYRD